MELWKGPGGGAAGRYSNPPAHVAGILNGQRSYSEVVKELEPVANKHPDEYTVLYPLAYAYLHLPEQNDKEKGAELMVHAGNVATEPMDLNNSAWQLVDNNVKLDDSLRLAQHAVQQAEGLSAKITLDTLTLKDARSMGSISSDWDTLGWVQFKIGHLEEAEKYLSAAWRLGESPTMGTHLGIVYEKEGKKHEAALAYAGALSSKASAPVGTVDLLDEVQRDEKEKVIPDPAMLEKMRTLDLPWKQLNENAGAEFFVMLAPGPRVVDVKFISGSEVLHDATKALAAAHFDADFPDAGPVQIVRRGRLSCGPAVSATHCVFVLYPPSAVNSVN